MACLFISHLLTTNSFLKVWFRHGHDIAMSGFCKVAYRKINYFCAGVNTLWGSLHTFIIVSVRKLPEEVCFVIMFLIERRPQS